MSLITPPTCWIIAGPNGVGKTTFALAYLPAVAHCHNFINADLIAASRLFLREMQNRIHRRQDLTFETPLAGRSYLKLIRRLKSEG